MAVVNRYTNIQPARYNPRSLQELMIAPQYMRQQHDAIDAGLAETSAGIAQVDPLDIHSKEAALEQGRLYDQVTEQADILAREGFNPAAKRDFLRLNAEYAKSISPTGKLGKINAAKQAMATERANFIANSSKMGHDPAKMAQRWDEHQASYSDAYNTTGQISNINPLMSPNYESIEQDIAKVKPQLGTTVTTENGEEGYSIATDPTTGMFVIKTESGKILKKTNESQIDQAINYLNTKWRTPGGAGYKSARWNDQSDEYIQDMINQGLGMMTTKETRDNTQTNYQFMSPPKPSNEGDPSKDFYTHSSKTLPVGVNYTDLVSNATEVMRSPSSDLRDKAKARQYLQLAKEADLHLENDVSYRTMKHAIAPALALVDNLDGASFAPFDGQFLSSFNTGERWTYNETEDGKYQLTKVSTQGNGQTQHDKIGEAISADQYAVLKAGAKTHKLMNQHAEEFRNDYVLSNGLEETTIIVPFDKTSEQSVQLMNSLKTITRDNMRPEDVTFYDLEGANERIELDEEVAANAIGIFEMADESDIKNIDVAKRGSSVGLKVKFTPKNGTSLDGESFDGTKVLEMYLPINNEVDPQTGQKFSPTYILDQLPPAVRQEASKLINTSEVSAATSLESVGDSAVPLNKYFNTKDDELELDFLATYENANSKFYTPYVIKGQDKRPMQWSGLIDPNRIDTDEEYVKGLQKNGTLGILIESSRNYRTPEGETLYEKYKLYDPQERDLHGAVTDMLFTGDIRLNNVQRIYELGKLTK